MKFKWIVVKYADEYFIRDYWPTDHQFSLKDSEAFSRVGQSINLPEYFETAEEGHPWLQKMRDLSPSVGYMLKSVI
jgi:hypothetical protein